MAKSGVEIVNPFAPDALWIKSRLFINRACDPMRDFEEQAFWACSALELLGKCALSVVSPLLVANPMDDGASFLAVSGLTTGSATSVQAKAVWSRCAKAFKPFNESEAKKISLGRNDYIHSALIGFTSLPASAWWPRYWTLVDILLRHMGRGLDEYVDSEVLPDIEVALRSRKTHIAEHLQARIERALRLRRQSQEGLLSRREEVEWDTQPHYLGKYTADAECPACKSTGSVYGDTVENVDVEYAGGSWDYEEIDVTLQVAVDGFYCFECHLDLDDWDLIAEAKLDEPFVVAGGIEDIPPMIEYNNE